ncbi:hypothetical protein K458DRAFT_387787 [Lentithecium fluviatile CBS 122367]|uniref:Uncharacterized protein n=1 Tax=Lentithecium fluviatile CBS 122367 TaxID=1168545 RepID=A0A6G1J5L6_9PLEO|nr:hypothetical protein K458DRAFT_387787 [Lentithecium fluviatile CBS 122367]
MDAALSTDNQVHESQVIDEAGRAASFTQVLDLLLHVVYSSELALSWYSVLRGAPTTSFSRMHLVLPAIDFGMESILWVKWERSGCNRWQASGSSFSSGHGHGLLLPRGAEYTHGKFAVTPPRPYRIHTQYAISYPHEQKQVLGRAPQTATPLQHSPPHKAAYTQGPPPAQCTPDATKRLPFTVPSHSVPSVIGDASYRRPRTTGVGGREPLPITFPIQIISPSTRAFQTATDTVEGPFKTLLL